MIEAILNHWLLYTILTMAVALVLVAVGHVRAYNKGFRDGEQKERLATARAMATIRKHYAVPVPPKGVPVLTQRGAEKLAKAFAEPNVVVGQCAMCGVDCYSHTGHPEPACPTRLPEVTAEEWCKLTGTTMDEMAEAQEDHEANDGTSEPIGRCPDCGAPVYTVPGYCGRCKDTGRNV